jgi:hypothetical protein
VSEASIAHRTPPPPPPPRVLNILSAVDVEITETNRNRGDEQTESPSKQGARNMLRIFRIFALPFPATPYVVPYQIPIPHRNEKTFRTMETDCMDILQDLYVRATVYSLLSVLSYVIVIVDRNYFADVIIRVRTRVVLHAGSASMRCVRRHSAKRILGMLRSISVSGNEKRHYKSYANY